jgi:hypothetical protein
MCRKLRISRAPGCREALKDKCCCLYRMERLGTRRTRPIVHLPRPELSHIALLLEPHPARRCGYSRHGHAGRLRGVLRAQVVSGVAPTT